MEVVSNGAEQLDKRREPISYKRAAVTPNCTYNRHDRTSSLEDREQGEEGVGVSTLSDSNTSTYIRPREEDRQAHRLRGLIASRFLTVPDS